MQQVTEITNWAVDLIGVRKTYSGPVHALRGVNIQVGRGEVFGLLGPNGAGKSTLVKIMMTIVRGSEIRSTILGRPIGHLKKLAVIGYLPEATNFPAYLKGRQVLDFFGALGKVPKPVRRRRADELLERVGLTEWADTRVRQYSKGMARRLGLAQALINDPELLVLDEPTDGLDPVGRRDVRMLLIELKKAGKTVFLNSHLLSEVESVCDRVAILNEGLVARQGTLAELTDETVEYHIRTVEPLKDEWRDGISRCGGEYVDGAVVFQGRDPQRVNEVIDLLRARGCVIESVQPQRFTLEDVFVECVGKKPDRPQDEPDDARAANAGETGSAKNAT